MMYPFFTEIAFNTSRCMAESLSVTAGAPVGAASSTSIAEPFVGLITRFVTCRMGKDHAEGQGRFTGTSNTQAIHCWAFVRCIESRASLMPLSRFHAISH